MTGVEHMSYPFRFTACFLLSKNTHPFCAHRRDVRGGNFKHTAKEVYEPNPRKDFVVGHVPRTPSYGGKRRGRTRSRE